MPTLVPTLQDHLAAPLEAGPPDVRGPVAVFPLFGAARCASPSRANASRPNGQD